MELDKLVGTFGLLGGLAVFSWPFLMKILDRMTTAKASHVASQDRKEEVSTGLADKAFTQNVALQQRLFDELEKREREQEKRDKEQEAEREVLNAFRAELKLASERVVGAVESLKNVLVHVGDLDVRAGIYFKSISSDIAELKSHIMSRKDQS